MMCNREPCIEACQKTLPCGHKCIGFCGEPCPDLCWKCDRSKLIEGMTFIVDATSNSEIPKYIKYFQSGLI
jgi:hypothetical protein